MPAVRINYHADSNRAIVMIYFIFHVQAVNRSLLHKYKIILHCLNLTQKVLLHQLLYIAQRKRQCDLLRQPYIYYG